jgi:hypothetical protein
VTAAGIGQQIIEHATPSGSHPQTVMRVDDRQLKARVSHSEGKNA